MVPCTISNVTLCSLTAHWLPLLLLKLETPLSATMSSEWTILRISRLYSNSLGHSFNPIHFKQPSQSFYPWPSVSSIPCLSNSIPSIIRSFPRAFDTYMFRVWFLWCFLHGSFPTSLNSDIPIRSQPILAILIKDLPCPESILVQFP